MGKKNAVKRPRGRVPGTPYPETSTPALRKANRLKNLKHGKYAMTVTPKEARTALLAKSGSPEAAEMLERYERMLSDGDMAAGDPMLAASLTGMTLIQRNMTKDVLERGVMVEEDVVVNDVTIGTRLKANPLIEHLPDFAKVLGHTAPDQLLTRKARGEGLVDAALAARLARDAMLRQSDKSKMPTPPIETTAKSE